MTEQQSQQVANEAQKHYSDEKFVAKIQRVGMDLGFKALHAATTLFVALKSPNLPNAQKLIIVGALGYLILPIDVVADFLPVVGLADDAFVIIKAVMSVYKHVDEDMEQEAHDLLKKWFGDRYNYEGNLQQIVEEQSDEQMNK